MIPERILIIEDEKILVKGLTRSLEQEGFFVDAAHDGEEGFQKWKSGKHDLIILDLMLPKLDGVSLFREIRKFSDIPVIMLTAKDEEIDKIVGLELGADDYMTKPFNTRELIARMRGILRRARKNIEAESTRTNQQLTRHNITIDYIGRRVLRDNKEINVTPKEFDILQLLSKNPGRVYSRETIFELVWGEPCYDTRTVDVHVKNIREKLKDKNQLILTKWGVGYYISKDEA
ncbi:response regulator transcription factor [Desulfuribacillus alkaliarsenatis]|uniref:DNA-binding response regulator n=1 Tax=Desulfuribacillus alkaliarsenatis TaxID=766136 RepID=A0A1E5G118_9FIRM|nr:response regulator transcription factor [Desulfuribacillus alkaliarsenatis]OEF96608.1 DNA-binding response regulator [Desulfuribacillus alkaliarsenatis]